MALLGRRSLEIRSDISAGVRIRDGFDLWSDIVNLAYDDFLALKAPIAQQAGIEIADDAISPLLKPAQKACVLWAARGGRRALFEAFGLGKTLQQLELARVILTAVGGRGLIVAPLGVRQEFFADARKLGVDISFIRSTAEAGSEGLYLTNYESVRDGKIDPAVFVFASLDEASILRSYGSKTFQTFLPLFEAVRFRFVATATPSPNRYKEIIHYAGFLGVMDTGQALTRFFQRDSSKANNLTLYPHKEPEFWLWVASWAIFLQRPSDLGFSDEGYDLPPLQVRWHEVKVDISNAGFDRDGQGMLMRDDAAGLAKEAQARRDALPACIAKLQDLLAADGDDHRIIWHDLEAERHAIEKAVPGVVSVYGAQDLDVREQAIVDFSDGKFRNLAAKPIIAGSGCNFQRHCHKAAFVGVGHKFNDFIQAIHRIQRFLQTKPVEIDVIYPESMREARRDLEAKWARHNELVANMQAIIRRFGLNEAAMADTLKRSIGVVRQDRIGAGWAVAHNDCVDETARMASDSVDLVVTSIPFANHYEYTPSYNDFGHTDGNAHFFEQMDFLTPQLQRVLKPGRLACIHVKDRINFGSVTGYGTPTVSPFHAETLFHFLKHGFVFTGMITVVTDVVRENNQTYRLGYTEMCKDGSKMGVGSSEYVLLMRKLPTDRGKAYADDRIKRDAADYSLARWQVDAHAFWRSSGDRLLTPSELAALPSEVLSRTFTAQTLRAVYSHEDHVAIGEALADKGALPKTFMALAPGSTDANVWHDVNRMTTLNGEQYAAGREKHVCPLQFDIVDRLIRRFSQKGELVFDPFGGLFTVPVRALKLGRRGAAVELNDGYFRDGVRYLEATEREIATPSLFDLMTPELEAAE